MAFDEDLGRYLAQYMRLGMVYVDMNFTHSARFIVVVMSCERLVSVLKPLHVKETWLAMYPIRIIIICLVFNALFLLPVLINAKVVEVQDGNTTEYMFTFRNYETIMAPFMVVQVIVQSFLPLLFLIPINIAIPLQYYRISARRRSVLKVASNEAMNQQGKITATVMVITFMYILLSAPLIAIKLLQFVDPDFSMNGKYRIVLWFVIDLSKFLAYLNAANDFVIYFVVSNSYRAVFKEMYCGRCMGKPISKMQVQDKYEKTLK
ncbi:MAG: 7 transmembrane receptor, partial [Candidatus Thiodiazotropha sp.]